MPTTEEHRTRQRETYLALLAERLAALRVEAGALGPGSTRRQTLENDHAEALRHFDAAAVRVGGRSPKVLAENPWIFWLGSGFIFVVEAFLNKIIFDMAANTAAGGSLLLAAVASVVLVTVAHWCGRCWRQIWSDTEERFVTSYVFWGLVLLFALVLTVLTLMALRAYFALEATVSSVDLFTAVENIRQLGLDFVGRAFAVPEALSLGGLNMLFLLVAFLFGFYSHDSDHEYDSRYRQEKATKAALLKSMSAYDKRIGKIHERWKHKITMVQRAFVSHGGSPDGLPPDNFKQDRLTAESDAEPERPKAPTAPTPADNVTVLPPPRALPGANPW